MKMLSVCSDNGSEWKLILKLLMLKHLIINDSTSNVVQLFLLISYSNFYITATEVNYRITSVAERPINELLIVFVTRHPLQINFNSTAKSAIHFFVYWGEAFPQLIK